MILKFQAPVPGEQPGITAGGLVTMQMPNGPRIGVLYTELTVTKTGAASGVVNCPLLTDVAHPTLPMFVKIDSKPLRQRLASELIADNLLQDPTAGGSVAYCQGGILTARVNNANLSNVALLAPGLAISVPTTAEGLALPTACKTPPPCSTRPRSSPPRCSSPRSPCRRCFASAARRWPPARGPWSCAPSNPSPSPTPRLIRR